MRGSGHAAGDRRVFSGQIRRRDFLQRQRHNLGFEYFVFAFGTDKYLGNPRAGASILRDEVPRCFHGSTGGGSLDLMIDRLQAAPPCCVNQHATLVPRLHLPKAAPQKIAHLWHLLGCYIAKGHVLPSLRC
jgi:hypothetical protein